MSLLVRASATIGGLTMISRVLGFIRDMMIASALGASVLSDAFFVAFKLPNFMRRLFAEGAFNTAFVPLFAGVLATEGKSAAKLFAEEIYSILLWILIAVTAIFMLAMPWVMYGLAPGFDNDPYKYLLSVELTRITMPYIIFISLMSLLGGILNSSDKFAAVAATPIIMNLCLIISQVLLVGHTKTPAHALAYGVLLAGAAQFFWLVWFCKKSDMMPRLRAPVITENFKKLMRLMAPAALGAGVMQINLMVDMMIASLIPNAVSYLYYADRISEMPLGVIGIAVATALLPMMSKQIREGKNDAAAYSQNRALELSFLLGLPAAAALVALAHPIISVMFERGAFGLTETLATYKALIAYACGLPAFLAIKIFAPGFFANRDTKTPVKIAIVCVLINFALNLALMGPMGHVGLALATTIAGWINAFAMGYILYKRKIFMPDTMLVFRLIRITGASLLMAGCVWLAYIQWEHYFYTGGHMRYVAMAILVSLGLVIFGVCTLLLRIVTREQMRGYFKKSNPNK
jgi:putative peptidoglycan lipid II flippase